MCSIDVDNPSSFVRERWQVARKTYTCAGCGTKIKPGDRYKHSFWLDAKDAQYERGCAACAEAMAEFASEHGCSFDLGALPEVLSSCFDGTHNVEFASLADRLARRRQNDEQGVTRWRTLYAQLLRRQRRKTYERTHDQKNAS